MVRAGKKCPVCGYVMKKIKHEHYQVTFKCRRCGTEWMPIVSSHRKNG